jgi:hypothetical protein
MPPIISSGIISNNIKSAITPSLMAKLRFIGAAPREWPSGRWGEFGRAKWGEYAAQMETLCRVGAANRL